MTLKSGSEKSNSRLILRGEEGSKGARSGLKFREIGLSGASQKGRAGR
jgi:hypothetical protein